MKFQTNTITYMLTVLLFITALPCHAVTVLDRIMKVEDPELGACIEFALKNFKERYNRHEDKELELVCQVTERYTEIKLFDTQIKQLEKQLAQVAGPGTLRDELFLAQVEIVSKRERAFAQLRSIMFILPRHLQEESPKDHAETVLDRAMNVEDPELGACIELGLKNLRERYNQYEDKELELVCQVTEQYAEIKLFDAQIKHLEKQVAELANSSSRRGELFLTKAEIESKRERAFAQLRKIMFILPGPLQ